MAAINAVASRHLAVAHRTVPIRHMLYPDLRSHEGRRSGNEDQHSDNGDDEDDNYQYGANQYFRTGTPFREACLKVVVYRIDMFGPSRPACSNVILAG